MTDQLPSKGTTKDQVSLDDLRRAISYATTDVDDFDSDAARERAKAEAWRTAFGWRNQARFDMVTPLQTPNMAEHREGMALIREQLR